MRRSAAPGSDARLHGLSPSPLSHEQKHGTLLQWHHPAARHIAGAYLKASVRLPATSSQYPSWNNCTSPDHPPPRSRRPQEPHRRHASILPAPCNFEIDGPQSLLFDFRIASAGPSKAPIPENSHNFGRIVGGRIDFLSCFLTGRDKRGTADLTAHPLSEQRTWPTGRKILADRSLPAHPTSESCVFWRGAKAPLARGCFPRASQSARWPPAGPASRSSSTASRHLHCAYPTAAL